jgi:hypothetical protein
LLLLRFVIFTGLHILDIAHLPRWRRSWSRPSRNITTLVTRCKTKLLMKESFCVWTAQSDCWWSRLSLFPKSLGFLYVCERYHYHARSTLPIDRPKITHPLVYHDPRCWSITTLAGLSRP